MVYKFSYILLYKGFLSVFFFVFRVSFPDLFSDFRNFAKIRIKINFEILISYFSSKLRRSKVDKNRICFNYKTIKSL